LNFYLQETYWSYESLELVNADYTMNYSQRLAEQTGQDDHHIVVKEEILHLGHANRGNIGDHSSFERLQHVRL
jgi:hypothetical protein